MDGRPIAQNTLLMVIGDLHVIGILAAPHEADPPLVVDPNAVRFSYALAATSGEPLLFKGDDFGLTDVRTVPIFNK